MIYEFSLGPDVPGLATLGSLGVIWPAHEFLPASEEVIKPNGGSSLVGWIQCTWHWGFITKAEIDILKTFCPGKSAPVYLRTLDDDDDWVNYFGQMNWPGKITYQNQKAVDFTIIFRALVEQI